MKRKIALLIALMSLMNFAACGDSGETNDTTSASTDTTSVPETELTDRLGDIDLEEFTLAPFRKILNSFAYGI